MTKTKMCPHGGGTYTTVAWNVDDVPRTVRTHLCKACRTERYKEAARNPRREAVRLHVPNKNVMLEVCNGLWRKLKEPSGEAELRRLFVLLRPWLRGKSDLATLLGAL